MVRFIDFADTAGFPEIVMVPDAVPDAVPNPANMLNTSDLLKDSPEYDIEYLVPCNLAFATDDAPENIVLKPVPAAVLSNGID